MTAVRTTAAPERVARLAKGWSREIIKCRAWGHAWALARGPFYAKKYHYYGQTLVCGRCTASKYQELSEAGEILFSRTLYPAGYLVKGMGRLGVEAKGVLRISALINDGQPIERGE